MRGGIAARARGRPPCNGQRRQYAHPRGDGDRQHGVLGLVERSFGWAVRFRSLSRENERLAATLGTLRFLGCACFMFATLFKMLSTDLISGSRTVTLASGRSEPAPAGLHFTGMAFCVVAAIVSVSFTEELTTHGILQAIDPDFKPNVDKSAFLR